MGVPTAFRELTPERMKRWKGTRESLRKAFHMESRRGEKALPSGPFLMPWDSVRGA